MPGPGYELIELRATNPSGFTWVWTAYGAKRLLREQVAWIAVHQLPGLAYSRLDSSFVAELEQIAERQVFLDPLVDDQGKRLANQALTNGIEISALRAAPSPASED